MLAWLATTLTAGGGAARFGIGSLVTGASSPGRSRDPWHTLVAETLLRRTRAAQVQNRIADVLVKYPTPSTMAATPPEEIRSDLYQFGLRWRAESLAESSRVIEHELAGHVPTDIDGLLALPGVGPYVAAATSATVTDAEVRLVDTNTVRVATRVAGMFQAGDIRRRAKVVGAIDALLGGAASARDWWAVLDLAASVCLPRAPLCAQCPLRTHCATGDAQSGDGRAPK